jgi:hydrogenase maturation protein HypF
MIERKRILITGQVQGVGFRPAVYAIATSLGLSGTVCNDTKGVTVELQGEKSKITEFLARLRSDEHKPPLAEIRSCEAVDIPVVDDGGGFVIVSSDSGGTPISQVTADIATCADCLAEMGDEADFRYRYPFINCTNCGPRYSIVSSIPYDRPNTTMSVFEMCDRCRAQYTDVADRRFHAQPVACPACGPGVELTDNRGKTIQAQSDAAIAETARLLLAGKILAIKGVGGFHLAVDALNEEAVRRLRRRKRRDHKPFAMMAASVEKIREYAIVSESAEGLLRSPQSPIVLLPKRKNSSIAPSVAEGVNTFGFMLCYAPLHYLLFAESIDVLVMTSANISDEPLICKNHRALERLGDPALARGQAPPAKAGVADAFLMHNREIYRQVDDSIFHFIDGRPVPLRRARGFVPTPVFVEEECRADVFAAGADMKNTFCFGKNNQLICSEHIGDLEDAEVYHHYVDSIEHLRKLFDVKPKIVACDLHPGYLSTRHAMSIPDVRVIQVQHHWAHIASVLVEHGLAGPVIGLIADGTGYGTDGTIWGCECLVASLEKFERFGHLDCYSLPGADKASKEAVRPAFSLLKKAFGDGFSLQKFGWLLDRMLPPCHSCGSRNPEMGTEMDSRLRGNDKMRNIAVISEQLGKGINCVETSSLGRVFDAAAAMLGLGGYNHFDAQLPMALEAIAAAGYEERYELEMLPSPNIPRVLKLDAAVREIVEDVKNGVDASIISAKFHNTISEGLLLLAQVCRAETNLHTVALSGGVCCNRYLTNRLIKKLRQHGFSVLLHQKVPANDGGVSLGQAAIAAWHGKHRS